MRVAVLVKQVPRVDQLAIGRDGRLIREGVEQELNPYCRRAVAKGIEIARKTGGTCTVFTLGPENADLVLRESVACGADDAVHVCDRAFAGSDTLATSRALSAALSKLGPFDAILAGRNSIDGDTGQVGPQVAEMLGLPYIGPVRELDISCQGSVFARCETDDGWSEVRTSCPVLITCAERLCSPAKAVPSDVAAVTPNLVMRVSASDLGTGPWGHDGSPTRVGEIREYFVSRSPALLTGELIEQAAQAARLILQVECHELDHSDLAVVPDAVRVAQSRPVAVLVEPQRVRSARELLGAASSIASSSGRHVFAIAPGDMGHRAEEFSSWGADEVVGLRGSDAPEDVGRCLSSWIGEVQPWLLLASSSTWGREVCSRLSVRQGLGLIGDVTQLELTPDGIIGWKPAFGGNLLAAITSLSRTQVFTTSPGSVELLRPRIGSAVPVRELTVPRNSRVVRTRSHHSDDYDDIATASTVIGVGTGVDPADYAALDPLAAILRAPLAATRRVTDKGWLPRYRQVGVTGRAIGPNAYLAIGMSGSFNHMVGVSRAGFILAINSDPLAPIFAGCDAGIVADWRQVVPLLADELRRLHA